MLVLVFSFPRGLGIRFRTFSGTVTTETLFQEGPVVS